MDEHRDGGSGGVVGKEEGVFIADCDGVGVVTTRLVGTISPCKIAIISNFK